MVLTLSIMAIIAAFSLYDYFSSKSWQMVTSKERNETVFENRNKEYGAYQIRRDYDKRILLVFLAVTVGIGALWGASALFKPLEQRKDPNLVTENITELFNDDEEEVLDIPEPEVVADQPAAQADITKFVPIEIKDNPDFEDKLNVVDPTKNIGDVDQKGDDGDIFKNPIVGIPGGTGGGGIIDVKKTDDKIHEIVDEDAMFPGGMPALREFIKENIDLNMIDGSAKVYLKFVVDTDGKISSVTVTKTTDDCKSCEKAAVKVVKSMPQWTPGKVNGEPVKSYYRLPINIQ